MSHVLFVCIQNAGRSQIAQALFERAAAGRHEARSAGSRPAAACPPGGGRGDGGGRHRRLGQACRTGWTMDDMRWADLVVTMGCGDECPYVPASATSTGSCHDPAGQPPSGVRAIRDEISARVQRLVAELENTG